MVVNFGDQTSRCGVRTRNMPASVAVLVLLLCCPRDYRGCTDVHFLGWCHNVNRSGVQVHAVLPTRRFESSRTSDSFRLLRVSCVWGLPVHVGSPYFYRGVVNSTVSVSSQYLLFRTSKRFVLWARTLQLPGILFLPQCTQGISVQCAC